MRIKTKEAGDDVFNGERFSRSCRGFEKKRAVDVRFVGENIKALHEESTYRLEKCFL